MRADAIDPRERWNRDGLFRAHSPIRIAGRAVNAIPMAGRMVLMELAHPAIASAVNDHDRFRDDPIRRARVTAQAIGKLIHGTVEEADAVSRHLGAVHKRVAGPGYAATDPSLVLWVAATYFDSVLLATEQWGRAFSPDESTELYAQMRRVIELLGCRPEDQPRTLPAFRRYVAETMDRLDASPTAVTLTRGIFWPSSKLRHNAPMALYRLVSFGFVSPRLRSQHGYAWTSRHERALKAVTRVAPLLRPLAGASLDHLADGRGRVTRVLMRAGGFAATPSAV